MVEQTPGSPVTYGSTPLYPPPASWSWYAGWARALLPTINSFEQLLRSAPATLVGAYSWVGLCTTLHAAIWLPTEAQLLTVRILEAAFVGLGGVLALSLSAHFAEWAGRLAGGKGTYGQVVYVFSLFLAPLALFDALAAPFMGSTLGLACVCLLPLSILYQLALFSVAVRAAHRVDWIYSIIIGVVAFVLFQAMLFGVGVLLGLGLAASGVIG